jgi:2-polyprenyl-3-methyl-5-hydroxy-6-metoxy-1,4-benzoquinol methylase
MSDAVIDQRETLKFQADEHEVIKDSDFKTIEEYVLHLMHTADYETAALLARGKTVLDLGCNAGHGTHILGRACERITGVDVSPAAIAAAESRHASDNVHFRLVDGMSLPFAAQSFDLITSFQVIEHLADYDIYLNEISRVLKPSGLLLITTPNAAIRVHAGQKPWNPFHVREFRASELGDLLKARFDCVQVLGQFASERTYAVEYKRCIRARGSLPAERSFVVKVARRSWRLVAGAGRFILGGLLVKAGDLLPQGFQALHSLEDFHYKAKDLDQSLSLVACCSSDEATSAAAEAAFQQKP